MVAVTANAQNLGIFLLEPGIGQVERGGLVGSTTGKVEDVKGEDYVLLSLELA